MNPPVKQNRLQQDAPAEESNVFLNRSVSVGTIVIRPLTEGDIDAVVRIHLEQFPGARSSELGRPFLRKMYQWFLLHQPALSLVALLDKQLAGFAVGAIGGYGRPIFRFGVAQVAWGLITHPRILITPSTYKSWTSYAQAFIRKPNVLPANGNNELVTKKASLASIAVTHVAHGRGIGRLLLRQFEEAAKECGVTTVGLSVNPNNIAARRLYEGCGWSLLRSGTDSEYFGKSLSVPGASLSKSKEVG